MFLAFSEGLIGGGAIVGAAIITGPMLWVLQRNDRRNTRQHAAAQHARETTANELSEMKTMIRVAAVQVDGTRSDIGILEGHVMTHLNDHAAHRV